MRLLCNAVSLDSYRVIQAHDTTSASHHMTEISLYLAIFLN